MFTGVAFTVRSVAGTEQLLRFKPRRQMVRVTILGEQIAFITGSSLAEHLAGWRAEVTRCRTWQSVEILSGKGEVQVTVLGVSELRLLTESERQDLTELAARPRTGRPVDRARRARAAARR
ncbi:hypothetical protein [Kineosporia sp. NBRC 101677]|uniref:hypothetical protein n=1 Tax=Kineosporia sp. NBRC 101677 TaxID=3032197 RepID=UPI002555D96E|nr:hypothetical protein [Kineosporia sp. NBRC 101677]